MVKTAPFDTYPEQYEQWFEDHREVYESELNALNEFIPREGGEGLEVGVGTGRYAIPLGIKEGVEASDTMLDIAQKKGLEVLKGEAEHLPYGDLRFDFVLFVTISYFDNLKQALREANRVLKHDGRIIIGFIDKNSKIGKAYIEKKDTSRFYQNAVFYTPQEVENTLKESGFKDFKFVQTLFKDLDDINEVEPVEEGYGKGSFVVVSATKKKKGTH